MTKRSTVEEFLQQKRFAVAGVSQKKRKFGYVVYKNLLSKGYNVFPVNPHAKTIDGNPCYESLLALPEKVDAAVIVTPPPQTEKIVRDAHEAGIARLWMQQGAESPEAIRFCEEKGISVVHGECILMFAEPAGWPHRLHRLIWKWLGKLPK
ncbi:MAG: CoA-binding protein [Candidatus Omnitrophota bacterium]